MTPEERVSMVFMLCHAPENPRLRYELVKVVREAEEAAVKWCAVELSGFARDYMDTSPLADMHDGIDPDSAIRAAPLWAKELLKRFAERTTDDTQNT